MDFYARTATHPGVRTVCEVGFNAGYSTAVWLAANPLLKVISFDLIMLGNYGLSCAESLLKRFPGRLEVQPISNLSCQYIGEVHQSLIEVCDTRPRVIPCGMSLCFWVLGPAIAFARVSAGLHRQIIHCWNCPETSRLFGAPGSLLRPCRNLLEQRNCQPSLCTHR